LCFREDALYAALPPRECSPDVALDVVAVEAHARAGREPPYERQVARGAERPEPHRVEPPRAQLGGEGSTHPGGFPFPGDVRNAVRDPEPRDAGDVAGMPPEMDRVEDRFRDFDLGYRALEAFALSPRLRVLANPEDANTLDLRQ